MSETLAKHQIKKLHTPGPYSQNFLSQICKIFVTLGLHILRLLKLKVSNYHFKLMLPTIKVIKSLFSFVLNPSESYENF